MLCDQLKKARIEAGFPTVYALWKTSGIALSTLSDLESGKIDNPNIKTLVRLADALDVSLDRLLERENTLCQSSAPKH
jgi:transcriptional regulator with XRE-family HTH domain